MRFSKKFNCEDMNFVKPINILESISFWNTFFLNTVKRIDDEQSIAQKKKWFNKN